VPSVPLNISTEECTNAGCVAACRIFCLECTSVTEFKQFVGYYSSVYHRHFCIRQPKDIICSTDGLEHGCKAPQ
jgi:hypothetical protein